ncbi:MAG: carbohydrate ABC transporter permease, partial [Spirochaetales bacterium]|nr:carbohydrate ABC transporter permease [Spirochaetales bacterium]
MVEKKSWPKRIGFLILILGIVGFTTIPFVQMISISLKHQWDWGNPSFIPKMINLDAYKELLNIGQSEKNVPESIRALLEETPDMTREQRKTILDKYQDTGSVFPFLTFFRNSLLLSFCAATISVAF